MRGIMVTDSALLLHLQAEVLEAIARGETLTAIAGLLCRRAETLAPGAICSILAVDSAGRLQPLAAPGLPPSYSTALVGAPIGPSVGSCGTAACRNQAVIVTDIDNDPFWENYRGLTQPLGLRACWSIPICDKNGQVVATFAFYYRICRGPSVLERDIVQTCLHMCTLAIDHDRVREHSHRLAYFDALTDLPNRGNFVELLAQAVARQAPFGLLLIDIDHLKIVNDTVGHVFGDLMIRTIARCISDARPDLLACRLDGDEFAVLIPDCGSETCLADAAHFIINAVQGLI
ncbi:MAG: diguanylate cyclase [Candidatus Devosia euplotis]|nr:diguanylate cyclase [Candidatus Devosia euplotis]